MSFAYLCVYVREFVGLLCVGMCVCVRAHMCVCVCVCMCVSACVCVCACVCICVCPHLCECMGGGCRQPNCLKDFQLTYQLASHDYRRSVIK